MSVSTGISLKNRSFFTKNVLKKVGNYIIDIHQVKVFFNLSFIQKSVNKIRYKFKSNEENKLIFLLNKI